MANCKYCGKKAGIMRSAHPECKNRNAWGKNKIAYLLSKDGLDDPADSVADQIRGIASRAFISHPQIIEIVKHVLEKLLKCKGQDAVSRSHLIAISIALGIAEKDIYTNEEKGDQVSVVSQDKILLYLRTRKFGVVVIILGFLIFGSHFYDIKYINKKSWPEIVHAAKNAVVVIKTPNAIGSGFLISPDGVIITNSHVIQSYNDIKIFLKDTEPKQAKIIKVGNEFLDIAILKIIGSNYEFLKLADSSKCEEGEEVLALGAPKNLSETVTRGIISNCNRQLEPLLPEIKYIQTDTPINFGNSGGPLVNAKGEVIGVVVGKLNKKDVEGINFAIASNVINDFKNGSLIRLEEVARKLEEAQLENAERDERNAIYLLYYTSNILRSTWQNEYKSYYNKIYSMVQMQSISLEQGKQLLQNVAIPPQGFSSVDEWFVALATRILKGEITMDEGMNLIRSSFIN